VGHVNVIDLAGNYTLRHHITTLVYLALSCA